jgi:hypothetical protein
MLAAYALPVAAWAAEPVPVTFPNGPLAVWQAKPAVVVAVGTVPPQLGPLPAGWRVSLSIQGAAQVVELTGATAVKLRKQGTAWQLGPAGQPLLTAHALLLRDTWQLGGTPLRRMAITAAGSRWQVGLTSAPLRQAQALMGVARRLGAAPQVATAPAPEKIAGYASIEPAAGLAPTPNPAVAIEALVGDVLWPTGLQPFQGALQPYVPGTRVPLPQGTPAATVPTVAVSETAATNEVSLSTAAVAVSPSLVEASPSATLPLEREPAVVARSEEKVTAELGVLIPPRGPHYGRELAEALQAVAEAPVGSVAAREARLALAGVYLAWQRPEEAQAVLSTLPQRADGLPAGAVPRLLMGVATLARGQVPQEGVFDQTGTLAAHAQLWAAVAANARGAPAAALEQWPSQRGILPEYPAYMRALAQAAQVNALVMTGQNQAALKALQGLAAGYGREGLPPELRRLRGLARLGTQAVQEGLEDLAAAAENRADPAVAAQAKLEFVQALHRRKEISDAQLRGYLRDLQQEWRGDETERQSLAALADLYEKANEPNNALKTWQTLLQNFPRTPEISTITGRMAQAFVAIFDLEADQTFDPLTYLGLYYDFRELLPNDERGDLVQERTAEALVKANLFDRAAPVLEQQLQYRPLEPVAQGRLTLLLAQTYRQLGRPEEAYQVLEARRALATTQTLRRGWALESARTLAVLNRPQAAAEVLQPLLAADQLEDKEAQQLAAEVAWQGQDWPGAITALNRILAKVPATELISNTTAQLQTFQLAYALGQTGQAEELAKLKARYQQAWPQLPQLADDINAVAASSGATGVPPEGGPLQALTTALSGINRLDDQVAQTRRQLDRRREDRDEYKRRMQYMELLPPPAL